MIIYSSKVNGAYKVKLLPIALINTAYKSDKGMRAHELEHIKQYCVVGVLAAAVGTAAFNWFIGLILAIAMHDTAYTFVRRYRLWAEVQAFKKQLTFGGSLSLAAKALSGNYDLKISYAEAVEKLS